MKTIILLISILIIFSCEKVIPNLERDNPYDNSFEGEEKDKIKVLEYDNHKVVCKLAQGSFIHSEENTINIGDRINLGITVKNTSNFNINKIRGAFSCSSNFIQLEQLQDDEYVTFVETSDSISSGKIGWAEITDGQYFKFAPNGNSYAIEFLVNSSAIIGDEFTIKMNLIDDLNNTWEKDIKLKIE